MELDRQVLRISIEGRWEANEFSQSLAAIDRLYALRFALDLQKQELRELRDVYFDRPPPPFLPPSRYLRYWEGLTPRLLTDHSALVRDGKITPFSSELLEPQERLVVQRIIYGSPGIKDLAGIGEIIGHVKDFLIHLIDLWSTREKRALDNQRQEHENEGLALDNQQKQIEIAKQFVGIADELGYTKREKRHLIAAVMTDQDTLTRLISAGKITAVDTIKEQSTDEV